MFGKNVIYYKFQKLPQKTLACKFIQKKLWQRCFSLNKEYLQTTASVNNILYYIFYLLEAAIIILKSSEQH